MLIFVNALNFILMFLRIFLTNFISATQATGYVADVAEMKLIKKILKNIKIKFKAFTKNLTIP